MLRFFRDVPIRRKLTLLMLLASVSGVLLTGAGLTAYAWLSARATIERDLASVSAILANNATAALAFRDPGTANEILSAMEAKPELESGCLYLAERDEAPQLFASYSAQGSACPPRPGPAGVRTELRTLVSVQPVVQTGERIGWLQLRASLKPLEQALAAQAGIMLGIVLFSSVLSVGVAFAAQRVFAGPILRLAATARQVSQTRDYGLRMRAYGHDEVGRLADDFNKMLGRIAESDEALRQSEGRVRLIVETALDAVVTMDDHGLISGWNPQAEAVFGWPAEEAVGRSLVDLIIPPQYREAHKAGLKHYLATGEGPVLMKRLELTALRRSGEEFPVELTISPLRIGARTEFSAFLRDTTERKRAEDAMKDLNQSLERQVTETARTNRELEVAMGRLKEAQVQLVQAEKLASLGALVAGIAHEINTPVGVGVTAASTLQARAGHLRGLYEKEALRRSDLERFVQLADESTQIILRNLQRAADLIHSFKQVAVDQSSGERRRFGLKSYVDEILLSLRPKLKNTSHSVEVDCPDDIVLDSYPGAIAQILTNFVTNSLIHGFEGVQNGHIRIAIRQGQGRVTLQYSDDGRGIAPEHLPRIFDPFFTTKRGVGGSGLGLHIVYNLVTQLLHGTIHVASEPGKGATFVIQLPAAAQKAAA
jgi:PAS domain S-box-containing protein